MSVEYSEPPPAGFVDSINKAITDNYPRDWTVNVTWSLVPADMPESVDLSQYEGIQARHYT